MEFKSGFEFEDFNLLYSVDRLAKSAIFRIYWSRIRAYSQKLSWSSWLFMEVYKYTKILQEVFVWRVQTELYNRVSRLKKILQV
jgi:hypothetical protein